MKSFSWSYGVVGFSYSALEFFPDISALSRNSIDVKLVFLPNRNIYGNLMSTDALQLKSMSKGFLLICN